MSDSPTFLQRFQSIVAELRAHPEVEVYKATVRRPVGQRPIKIAEGRLARPLPEAMRAFYSAHNGVFLQWGLKGRDYREKAVPAFHIPDIGAPPGCINLLPLTEAINGEWQFSYTVNEISDNHWKILYGDDTSARPYFQAFVIDYFARYHHADLINGPQPYMVVSTDYGADMDSSDYTTFDEYLDATLSLYGLCRYDHAFGIGWTRRTQRAEPWSKRPTLDEIIALVKADEG